MQWRISYAWQKKVKTNKKLNDFLNLSLVFTAITDFVDRGWGQLGGYFPPTRQTTAETKTRNCAHPIDQMQKNDLKNK